MDTKRLCIWCARPVVGRQPREHIVPEAIGCAEDWVLTDGEVCGNCNNGLAHIDQALYDDLAIFAMMAGVTRKGGKAPAISSYGNMRARVRGNEAEWFFNNGPAAVKMPDNQMLPPFRGRERDVNATFEVNGDIATIEFPISFGTSPKVARALVKIAGEYFCLRHGREAAIAALQGPVADFVRFGKGSRPVILCGFDKTRYQHRLDQIYQATDGGYICPFRLAHFEVIVDLSPSCSSFLSLAEQAYRLWGPTGWTTLPPNAFQAQIM